MESGWQRAAKRRLAAVLARAAPGRYAGRLRRPCFLIGCGRSGSTALRLILACHPELAVFPGEANHLWHPRAYPWRRFAADVPPFWADPRRFTALSLERRTVAADRALVAAFGAWQAVDRAAQFVNKSSMIHFMLPKVDALFPGARFVHLVRDGRAVALSYARKVKGEPSARSGTRDAGDFVELLTALAGFWRESVAEIDRQSAALGLVSDGRYHELAYEQLCADPHRALAGLASFLGVGGRPFEAVDRRALQDRNRQLHETLSPELIELLGRETQPALTSRGYG